MNRIYGMTLATALALAGCGGGGGGDGNAPLPATTNPTSISGIAAKGIVKQATVLGCRIVNGAPAPDTSCATTSTANDGSFSFTFNDGFTGPLMVKVMAGAASTMMDETTGIDVAYGMTMRAVVPAVSQATAVYVTPFSEMAASAVSMTTVDPTTIRQAIAAVESAMLTIGVDLSVMPMMNLKANGADFGVLTRQANMAKQLARLAMAARFSNLLKDANGIPCNAPGSTTSQQFACAAAAMAGVMNSYATADPGKLANLLAALNAQNVTSVSMPILMADGTLGFHLVDMTSYASMQAAMQDAGMTASAAANAVNVMMAGMR